MAASLVFLPITLLVGEAQSDYSHVSDHISALTKPGAAGTWAQTANFVLFGVLIAALAFGLHRGIDGKERSVLGPLLVGVGGVVASVGSAIFREEPVRSHLTPTGTMHATLAIVGAVALIAAMLVYLPRRLDEDPRWMSLAGPSRWLGATATALFFAFPLAVWGIVGGLEHRSGLVQRGFFVVVLLWLFLLSLRLFQTSRVRWPAGERASDDVGELPGAAGAPLGDLEVA